IDVLANDSDLDGDTITVQSVTQPAHGNVVIEGDGTVTYTPVANYNGPDSFTYTITDGQGGTDTATVSITVNPQNDPPVALDDAYSTDEDIALEISAASLLSNDTDIDQDTLVITGFTQPLHGEVVDNGNGTFTYKPDSNYFGDDSFTYTVSDGNGGTDSATVNLTVNSVNDSPEAEPIVIHSDNLAGDLVDSAMPIILSGDSENIFAWTSTGSNELYSNGKLVTVTYGDSPDTLVGTVEGNPDPVFTLSVSLDGDQPSFTFDQQASMMAGYTTTDPIDFGSVHGGSGEAYGFALFDDSGELIATAKATADSDQDAVNTNSSIMGADNTFIDAGEALTIDFSADSGSFVQGGNTYDYMPSGIQSLTVTLDAQADKNATATYMIYGVDADGNEIHSSEFQTLNVDGQATLTISTADLDGAVYIDKVVFSADDATERPYQLSFDTMTTLAVDEDVSMTFPYSVSDDDESASSYVTVNLYGGDEEVGYVYHGTTDVQDVFDLDDEGSDVTITNYDTEQDVLEVSDVIDSDSEVTAETLEDYMQLTRVGADSDSDGVPDDVKVDIDSDGFDQGSSVLTTVYLEDQPSDVDEIDDLKVDYESN
ncbi:cadherin-like domain-containing protein, partial [Thiomicrorhabdus cannonii]|uniref:cadherin-like domain-containing protein n=1 Tax=Thiomicrorhabdus cannonii TaxID=2748011 RepID=UPI0015C12684